MAPVELNGDLAEELQSENLLAGDEMDHFLNVYIC